MIGDFHRLLLERGTERSETAARLQRWARSTGVEVGIVEASPVEPFGGLDRSKRALRVSAHVGAVLRPCTGRTDSLLCCNLRVVTQVVGCPLDCSYCVLQHYQNRGEITVRADPRPILDELARDLARQPRRLLRVCTGQVADSLALEPEVGFTAAAVERFASLPSGLLELKTKTDRVEPLLGLEHRGRTVVSFSLNPEEVTRTEEHGAAPLAARLGAARRAAGHGYLIAFHLDPMVTVDGNPGPHAEVVRRAAAAVPADRVAYVSMGTVRFPPAMRRAVSGRFATSRVTLAELLPDVDGKLRLATPLRVRLYREVAREIGRCFPEAFVYLCMEPRRIWRRALGLDFEGRGALELALARSLHARFGLAPSEPRPPDYVED